MWNQWKIFEKMTKDLNHVLFGGPKWPGKWASEADIQHTSKNCSDWHASQDWCETSGNFEKMTKDRIFFFYLFGGPEWPKNWTSEAHWYSPRIQKYMYLQNSASEAPLCHTPLKVLAVCETILMWKQWKLFEKVTKVQNFDLRCGPKWPKNWNFGAHIVHISESSSELQVRPVWTQRKLFNKIVKNLNFASFGGPNWPKNLDLWGSSFTHLQK